MLLKSGRMSKKRPYWQDNDWIQCGLSNDSRLQKHQPAASVATHGFASSMPEETVGRFR